MLQNIQQEISDATGFDLGDQFENADQVRQYFTVQAQRVMFGEDAIDDQDLLAAWAERVIEHGWHMVKPADAVEVAVIRGVSGATAASVAKHTAVATDVIARCLDTLGWAGVTAVWQTPGEDIVRLSVRPDDYRRSVDALKEMVWSAKR